MFERGNKSQGSGKPSVTITLSDGRTVNGNVLVPPGRMLFDFLNSPWSFVEFEPAGAPRTYIAKSDMRSVSPVTVAPAPSLPDLTSEDGFNPFAVLGVTAGADKGDVHRAYIRLAKIYHPDQYATAGLPQEVCDYLSAMARRVNAAYEAVEAARPKPAAARQEAVFRTS